MPEPPVTSGQSASASPRTQKILIPHGVENGVAKTFAPQSGEIGADRRYAATHRRERDETDLVRRLAREHATQIGIAHRRQRMVAHTQF